MHNTYLNIRLILSRVLRNNYIEFSLNLFFWGKRSENGLKTCRDCFNFIQKCSLFFSSSGHFKYVLVFRRWKILGFSFWVIFSFTTSIIASLKLEKKLQDVQKKGALGFPPDFSCSMWAFRGLLNIIRGSSIKIKSCQVRK